MQLTVTRDFGARIIAPRGRLKLAGQETVLSLLMRGYSVTTSSGGFVRSINGLSGGDDGRQPVAWFFYRNGVEPSVGAGTVVDSGDHIWWDLHDWSQADEVPAVVGSFPEPFLNGVEGRHFAVRIECSELDGYACETVSAEFHRLDVAAVVAGLEPSSSDPDALRVLVGPWPHIARRLGAQSLERGPRTSGVYALFSSDGQRLTPLDAAGRRMRALGTETGLIAATRSGRHNPIWVVTGTDTRGVDLASGVFTTAGLHDHFAVAVVPGRSVPLPEEAP